MDPGHVRTARPQYFPMTNSLNGNKQVGSMSYMEFECKISIYNAFSTT